MIFLFSDVNRGSQSVVSNFAPKATVKTKGKIFNGHQHLTKHFRLVLPRLYERLLEEKANEPDSDDEDEDEADSNFHDQSSKSTGILFFSFIVQVMDNLNFIINEGRHFFSQRIGSRFFCF